MFILMTLSMYLGWMSPEMIVVSPIGMSAADRHFFSCLGLDRGIISFKNEFEACLLAVAGQRT